MSEFVGVSEFVIRVLVAVCLLCVVFIGAGAVLVAMLAAAEWLRQIQRVLEWL